MAHQPRVMLRILIHAYSQKIASSRVIARRCIEDVVFIWLSGMQRPDFRTISDFGKNNIKVLKKLFKQVVQIYHRLEMVGLRLVAIDGTKKKAAASDYGARTQDSLKEAPKAVEADIKKYMAADTLYGENTTGQQIKGSDKTGKKEPKLNPLENEARFIKYSSG